MTVATIDDPGPTEPDEQQVEPRNTPSEEQFLGAVLLAGQADMAAAHTLVDEIAAIVEPRDLWLPLHEHVWQAMVDATALGEPVDPAAVAARVHASGVPRARELAIETLSLLGKAGPVASATFHARQVARAAQARKVIAAGRQLVQRGFSPDYDGPVDIPAVIGPLEQLIAVSSGGPAQASTLLDRALDLIENPEHIDTVPSGLTDLDMLYPGMRPGQLIVIGARPSLGKSVFGLTLAAEAAIRLGYPTLLISMEMTHQDVMARLIAARAGVDLGRIQTGRCDDADWDRIARAAGGTGPTRSIADAPLTIDDTSDLSIADIRAQVRRHARRGLRLVVIDYLQLIRLGRTESRQTGVDEVTRQLKVLAGDAGVPIVLLCQLNRGPEQRQDKRPMLSDLRESGGIENHADVVILMHRPDFYDPESPRVGECDLIVAKHRNGRTGTATVTFQGHYARLATMAQLW